MATAEKFENRNRKMIIKGSGKFMAKVPGCDELLTLGTMTNMRLDIQLDMQDIEGGDSTVPIDTLLRKKTIDITAEDAKFDLNMVRLATGGKLREGITGHAYQMVTEQLVVAAGTPLTVILNAIPYVNTVSVLNGTTNQMLDAAEYTLSGTTITFDSGVTAGDTVYVFYGEAVQADPDGYVWVLEEKHDLVTPSGKTQAELALKFPLFEEKGSKTEHISVRLTHENYLLKQTTSTTPTEGEYYVDVANNLIIFNDYLDGEQVYVNYKRPEVVDVLEIGKNDFPMTVLVVHDGQFEQKNGSIQAYQTELYACRVKSNFTLDAARQTASTHSVTLSAIDPDRADGRIGAIKRYQLAGIGNDC